MIFVILSLEIFMGRDNTGLQEIRWSGEESIDKRKKIKQGQRHIAFKTNAKFTERILEIKEINERITYLRIKNNMANIYLQNFYAPTNEASEDDNHKFYKEQE